MNKIVHTPAARLLLRTLHSRDDYAACVELQRITWGEAFREIVPAAVIKVSQRVGGVAAGAFDEIGEMVGFVFGLTGFSNGRPVHWSHMLAVRANMRDYGVGRQLKQFQRAELATAGVHLICWTYDPLVARNAHLNLNRLGVEVLEYVPDMYAPTGSDLHTIGTDRLVVCFDGTKAQSAAAPRCHACRIINEDAALPSEFPRVPCIGIEVPVDITAESTDAARRWRATTRVAFLHYLAAGYHIRGLCRGNRARPYYLLCTR